MASKLKGNDAFAETPTPIYQSLEQESGGIWASSTNKAKWQVPLAVGESGRTSETENDKLDPAAVVHAWFVLAGGV